jgi:hypothetical protein
MRKKVNILSLERYLNISMKIRMGLKYKGIYRKEYIQCRIKFMKMLKMKRTEV